MRTFWLIFLSFGMGYLWGAVELSPEPIPKDVMQRKLAAYEECIRKSTCTMTVDDYVDYYDLRARYDH